MILTPDICSRVILLLQVPTDFTRLKTKYYMKRKVGLGQDSVDLREVVCRCLNVAGGCYSKYMVNIENK